MTENSPVIGAVVTQAGGPVIAVVVEVVADASSPAGGWLRVQLSVAQGAAWMPLAVASADSEGRLVVPYSLADIAAAPTDDGHSGRAVGADLADALLRHYGLDR